jgi:prevent-host-death family protein
VPAKEFRLRLAEYLDAARAGEEIVITRGGRLTAKLGPPEKETSDDRDD